MLSFKHKFILYLEFPRSNYMIILTFCSGSWYFAYIYAENKFKVIVFSLNISKVEKNTWVCNSDIKCMEALAVYSKYDKNYIIYSNLQNDVDFIITVVLIKYRYLFCIWIHTNLYLILYTYDEFRKILREIYHYHYTL